MSDLTFSVQALWRNPYVRTISASFLASSCSDTLRSIIPTPLGFLCQIAIMFIIGMYWFVVLVLVVVALFSKQWMASSLRAVSLAASVALAFVGLKSGDYLHLFMFYPHYRSVINKTTERPVLFYWGDDALIIPDGFQLRTLVYDDSGKTDEELSKKLDTERRREGLSSETTHFVGNFFLEHAHYAND